MKNTALAFLVSALTLGSLAQGCLHFNKKYTGVLKEGTKGVFLFHDGKNAHLVVRTDLKAIHGSLPEELAWVMPFPSLPSKYEEVSSEIFTELGAIAATAQYGAEKSLSVRGRPAAVQKDPFKLHAVEVAGDYKIQPIEITAESDGKAFNEWLSTNQFNPMPDALQQAYLHKGAVFLAIRVALKGKASDLKPIHIVYPATELSFPLKFTHQTRTFNVDLYTLTKEKVALGKSERKYLSPVATVAVKAANLNATDTPELGKLIANAGGFLSKFEGRDLNVGGKKLRNLTKDPVFIP